MTEEYFWKSNLSAYYRLILANNRKQEIKIQEIDILAWKVGVYIGQLFQSMPVPTALVMDRKVLSQMPKYPTSPLCLKDKIGKNGKDNNEARKINTTPPTPDEIIEYNRKMLMLRKK